MINVVRGDGRTARHNFMVLLIGPF